MNAADLRVALGADAGQQARIDSLFTACSCRIKRYAKGAPLSVRNEALILYAAWLYQSGAQGRSVFPADGDGPPVNVSRAFLLSGAQGLLSPWRMPRAGATVLP